MKLFEMEGFLRGKCIPRDLKVNETNAEYLVRKFAEADAMCAALAAENTGVKAKGRELLGEACAVYAKFNKLIDPEIGDFIDGQTLHEFQYVLDCETPATDAFLAEVRASAVDEVCLKISNAIVNCYQDELVGLDEAATICGDFASEIRKGVQS
ncbi:hypothetical protein SPM19_16995 [Enterobacter hormaechei subsp. xiangfangensis]|uniref:hypothetical protein n=1 Tax=Enterobacter hormaechei TaxID=158836 RepID=UPI00209B0582|nr:hypothetical protein [Enterobacter hormaechei]MCO7378187.1 hypothetical protein [Enterobacter hormaechei]MCU2664187.1 hypothetical protein [Enterobacter hormaechei subsp. steigerwaltii]MCU3321988.1 hypothetical protein [Enterobacter hormaechei subsp. steigerwaltii]